MYRILPFMALQGVDPVQASAVSTDVPSRPRSVVITALTRVGTLGRDARWSRCVRMAETPIIGPGSR